MIGAVEQIADSLWELVVGDSLNISPMRCAGVPKPPDEKVNLSGWPLTSATSSETDFAGTAGFTTSTLYDVDSLTTGAKSVSSWNGMFGRNAGAALTGNAIA
jgi:hypothetical protein